MKNNCFILVFLLLSASLAGCLGEDQEEAPRFTWPEQLNISCDVSENEDLGCDIYLDGFGTPVVTVKHPILDEIWIVDLQGMITSWDGNQIRQVANLSTVISTCHYEQGLLGMTFDEDFANTGVVDLSVVVK